MNTNKIKDIIIIMLGLICIVLAIFIIYNKLEEKSENDITVSDDKNTTTDERHDSDSTDNEVLLAGYLFGDLLSDEQKKLVNLDMNFDNITFTINNIPVTYSCTVYQSDYPARCTEATISFGNHTLTINNESLGCGHSENIIYTSNYLILQKISECTQNGEINIYDNNDKLLLNINNVTSSYGISDETINDSIELIDNKLYYISYDNTKYEDSFANVVYYSYVDLEDSNYKTYNLKEIKR